MLDQKRTLISDYGSSKIISSIVDHLWAVTDHRGIHIAARGSIVDLATRTLERESRRWGLLPLVRQRQNAEGNGLRFCARTPSKEGAPIILWQWRRCISYGAYKIACAVPYLLAIESILVPAVIVAILAQVLCVCLWPPGGRTQQVALIWPCKSVCLVVWAVWWDLL